MKVFFGGLNELRAVAAFSVVVHHVELYKAHSGIPSLFDSSLTPLVMFLGAHGVNLFFVLSGFLITYLLLVEENDHGRIDTLRFYIRRTLRIWPLYYLLVLVTFFVVPLLAQAIPALRQETFYYSWIERMTETSTVSLLLFLLFLPNIALQANLRVVGLSQAWSVGVEEQFYLLWPQVIRWCNPRMLPFVLGGIIVILPAFKLITESSEVVSVTAIAGFLKLFRIEFMAIGGATALLLYHHAEFVKRFTNSPLLYASTVAFIGVLTTHGDEFSLLLGLLYAALLLFTIDDRNPLVLRCRSLSELGKISYGLYMYHPLVMYGCFALIHSHLGSHSRGLTYNGLIYGAVFSLSISVSLLSYRFVEQPFLRLKNRQFTVIESGSA